MLTEIHLPTLGIVVGSALIDSINPCAIGVLILMISVIMGQKHKVTRMLFLGGLYIFAIFVTYLLAGLGLLYFLAKIPLFITEYLSIFVGVLIIIFGFFEIKYYFYRFKFTWKVGKTMSIPKISLFFIGFKLGNFIYFFHFYLNHGLKPDNNCRYLYALKLKLDTYQSLSEQRLRPFPFWLHSYATLSHKLRKPRILKHCVWKYVQN